MIRSVQTQVLSDKVSGCGWDMKKLYSIVNGLIGRTVENPTPESESDEQLAEDFTDYFMEKIKKIWDSLSGYQKYKPNHKSTPTFSTFILITKEEAAKLIGKMASKSCELDPLLTTLLKEILPSVIGPLTKIINVSLTQGIFADTWKIAVIRPIIKKLGLDLLLSNYRPVSNLSFWSRLVENAVLQQFNKHCDQNNLIPDYQSVYRVNYSCETALVKIVNNILWSMENKNIVNLMAIDLSAAFDTMDWCNLLDCLQYWFGITGSALKWFEQYLRPRYCKVNVGKAYPKNHELECSVPQGSCAGPVLYTVYASTFQEVIENPSLSVLTHGQTGNHRNPVKTDLHRFVDDHTLKNSFQAKSRVAEQTSIKLLENTAIDVKSWMDKNQLCMNDGKTEFIMFGSRQMLQLCTTNSIHVNGSNIARSEVIRYLGVWLDQSLQLRTHINNKCRIVMLNLQRVKLVRPFLAESPAHTLTNGLITSHLDYCNAIFSGIPNYLLDHLQHVHNSTAKLVCNKRKYDSAKDCLMYLHWLPVRARIDYKIAMMVHKCLNDKAPDYLKDLLTVNQPTRMGLHSSQFSNILVILVLNVKHLQIELLVFMDHRHGIYCQNILKSNATQRLSSVN